MGRLIDADALMKEVCGVRCGCMPDECGYADENGKYCNMAQHIEAAPTVLHETDLDETEQKILRKFRELREKGRKNRNIHSPTAWALYWTWRDLEMWSNVIDRKEADHEQTDTAQSVHG